MSVRALSRFFGLGIDDFKVADIPLPENVRLDLGRMDDKVAEAVLATYDIGLDDANLRADAGLFERLRGDYPLRREFDSFVVSEKKLALERLGFLVSENC
jgi:erythronate-4-phosphate dehydrogenase